MAVCVGCGNTSGRMFTVQFEDRFALTFDSIQCAIPFIAPTCDECLCQILGLPVMVDDEIYCSAACARIGTSRSAPSHVRRIR
jgi:hypothetical protein